MLDCCFAYGSLMNEMILAEVAGISLKGATAVLDGYARHPVLGEDYPGMVPDPAQSVSGILYRGLPHTALDRLDRFEGTEYIRCRVTVRVTSGLRIPAWAYVFRPELRSALAPGNWDYETFMTHHQARFRSRYLGD